MYGTLRTTYYVRIRITHRLRMALIMIAHTTYRLHGIENRSTHRKILKPAPNFHLEIHEREKTQEEDKRSWKSVRRKVSQFLVLREREREERERERESALGSSWHAIWIRVSADSCFFISRGIQVFTCVEIEPRKRSVRYWECQCSNQKLSTHFFSLFPINVNKEWPVRVLQKIIRYYFVFLGLVLY